MSRVWAWAKAHERRLWWAFLVASVAVGQARSPSCGRTPWWGWALPVAIFVGMWLWMRWTLRVKPRRRAIAEGDEEAYIRTAVRGKRIQYVAWTDTTVTVYTRGGDLVIQANVAWDGEPTEADHAVLDRLDVGSTLSVDLR